LLVGTFQAQIALRFPKTNLDLATDVGCNAMLARDLTNHALGPHTDHPQKLISLLFYLPADDALRHLGTDNDRNPLILLISQARKNLT